MIRLTRWSLRWPWLTIALAVVVTVAGVYSLTRLNQELLPNIEFPVVSVITRWPGTPAETMVDEVTIPIEEAVRRVPGALNVTSISSSGFSLVILQAEFGPSSEELKAMLERELAGVSLPEGVEPPQVAALNLNELPIVRASVSGDRPLPELYALVQEQVVPRLKALEGVGEVEVSGGAVAASATQGTPAPEPTVGPPVPLPPSWQQAGAMRGVKLETTADVTPRVIAGMARFAPQMLDQLTPEMLRSLSPRAAYALPKSFLEKLDPDLRAELEARAQEALAGETPLPASWQQLGILTPADVRPKDIRELSQENPEMLAELQPEHWRGMPPEALAALPQEFLEAMDPALRSGLEARIAEAPVVVPEATINRTNGQPSVGIAVLKTRDANTVAVVHRVERAMEQLQEELNKDIAFHVIFEQASFIEESIAGVSREGVLGAFFAILVIFLFLHFSVRSTLVTAVSIPLSVLIGFALMKLGGLTLNMMTLGGMTVAVGRVVDDSIVVLENIYRHIQRGDDLHTSVLGGTREVAMAILASTATTVAVFLPLGLIGGLIGEFFLPFALTVTFALAASYLVAITVVPLLAYLLIRKEHLPPAGETWMQRLYTPTLRFALRHRAVTLVLAFAFFLASLGLVRFIPLSFLPKMGESTINVQITMPPGTDMATTDETVRQVETYLKRLQGVETFFTVVGSSEMESSLSFGGVDPRQAAVMVTLQEGANEEALVERIRGYLRKLSQIEEARVTIGDFAAAHMGGFDLVITAENYEDLVKANDLALAALREMPELVNVSSDLPIAAPGQGLSLITRINGQQAIQFSAEVRSKDLMRVNAAAREKVASLPDMPPGVRVEAGFTSRQQVESFQDMGKAMVIGTLVVYLIMTLAFRSPVHPFTILFSLPFAATGALFALFLSGRVLGVSALIGMLMLIGIVVTNAIVLIDRVQQNRTRKGMGAREALIEAGRTRLRPIWMTALAAVLALIPLALGFTEGALIASELATVVIGGLLVSTFLTLVVVPTVYSLVDDLAGWLRRRRRGGNLPQRSPASRSSASAQAASSSESGGSGGRV